MVRKPSLGLDLGLVTLVCLDLGLVSFGLGLVVLVLVLFTSLK